MNWWIAVGAACLGLVIGWLVWTFVVRAPKFELKALSTVASVVGGSLPLLLWRGVNGSLPSEANTYFVGVFVAVAILGLLSYNPPPNSN